MTTALTPLGYALTIGTSSMQILASNPSRKGLMFFNPSSNTVAVCPAFNNNMQPLAAVINGAGAISVLPSGMLVIPQAGWADNIALGSAFNGIASGASTPFSIWEF
jgi:hypothetical protein